jgi:putative DNA-invertase from lambdoid prophage Rac
VKTFGYGRVSTSSQTSDNQRQALDGLGYKIDYWYEDTISGKTPARSRPKFNEMLGKMRDHENEKLVVLRIDRLGRDAADILQTVDHLRERGIQVIVHQLGGVDLTSPAGKMMLTVLAGLAEMERELLIERIHDGLARAKDANKKMGRPSKLSDIEREEIKQKLGAGESVSQLARNYKISRASIHSIKNLLA